MSELKHTSPILIIGNLISLVYLLQCRQTPGQMTMPEVIQQEITKKNCIKSSGILSEFCISNVGILQREVLSPMLFFLNM